MDINAIIVELLGRIKELENRVNTLETAVEQLRSTANRYVDRPIFPVERVSRKYLSLAEHLYDDWSTQITLSYDELERVLGFSLPNTAHNFPKSYWANTRTHSYATSWLELGYKAKEDYENKCVTFVRDTQ